MSKKEKDNIKIDNAIQTIRASTHWLYWMRVDWGGDYANYGDKSIFSKEELKMLEDIDSIFDELKQRLKKKEKENENKIIK